MPRLSKIGAACLAAFGWTGLSSVTASYLVVAGGAGGGYDAGGGGGAGGFRTGTESLNPTLSYSITVGAGGAGGNGGNGVSGSNSVFSTITSAGGGGGGQILTAGINGGSGGGGGADASNTGPFAGGSGNTPSTSPSQGNNGGAGAKSNGTDTAGGGGGGANAVGGTGNNYLNSPAGGGAGGAGTSSSITGSSVTYAGGGGGGGYTDSSPNIRPGGTGGTGGGGTGGSAGGSRGTAGTANLGGGGGGGAGAVGIGGQGGSGVVIISYVGAQQFGGGIVTSSGGSTIHTFNTSGTLSPLSSLTASCLVVAGGGGGGGGLNSSSVGAGGGGGAGGFRTGSSITIDTNSIYVVTVGGGGNGALSSGVVDATNGSNSVFFSVTSAGGGKGGSYDNGGLLTQGGNGGSGGGNGYSNITTAGQGNTPSTSPSQGNNGGLHAGGGAAPAYGCGGGGGAGAVGDVGTTSVGGNGGAGSTSSISGSAVTYAGGGGGGADILGSAGGTGGAGGGGNGSNSTDGSAGTANLGGGGGGGGNPSSSGTSNGGGGGSGVVVISYAGATQLMAGGTVTVSGGNVIHTFTSSGFLTPIVLTTNSLRFRSSASAYLNRTPPVASNRKTWTWSAWVKRGGLSSNQSLFAVNATGDYQEFRFTSSDNLRLILDAAANNYAVEVPTVVWRDPAAWYHIVLAVDTTQATSTNRVKIYVNGIQQTVSAVSGFSFPAQNFDTYVNATLPHAIGNFNYLNSLYFDGYMTEINFIDGLALTPSSFGTTSDLGVWQPIRYGGSYGTNGFYLKFTDTTNTTTLGYDSSPNSNNWTTNNISLTAGSTYDSMTDVPTLTSATAGNYATLNPLMFRLSNTPGATLSNGNLTATHTPSGYGTYVFSTIMADGNKFYYEMTATSVIGGMSVGIDGGLGVNSSEAARVVYLNTGGKRVNGVASAYGSSYTTGDVIGVELDLVNGTITFYKQTGGTGSFVSQGVASSSIGTTTPYFTFGESDTGSVANWNYGQRPFNNSSPPSGFVALNTFNLPAPPSGIGTTAATLANKYMNVVTYTGNGTASARSITGVGFQPDWVWGKGRSVAAQHNLFDAVRGVGNRLISNSTGAESSNNSFGYLSSFDSDGFSTSAGSTNNENWNETSATYVAWNWKANGAGSANTVGTIASTVSANTTAGFSIVTYTGNATSAQTVGHGLGVTPTFFILKSRGTQVWNVYSLAGGATGNTILQLNDIDGLVTGSNISLTASSTTIGFGSAAQVNGSSVNFVAYVFAPVAGYSAFGSYTGNGAADGPFVFTGFRPRWIMFKQTSSSGAGWLIYDSARNTYNLVDLYLQANQSNAEAGNSTDNPLDFLSNGFKLRYSNSATNQNGATYIYIAFAENPFKYANAR